jgi:hypothetical protein
MLIQGEDGLPSRGKMGWTNARAPFQRTPPQSTRQKMNEWVREVERLRAEQKILMNEDHSVDEIINTILLLCFCFGVVLVGVMVWVLFSPNIQSALRWMQGG